MTDRVYAVKTTVFVRETSAEEALQTVRETLSGKFDTGEIGHVAGCEVHEVEEAPDRD